MNEFARYRRSCLIGVKAFQNVRASLRAIDRLCSLIDSEDHVLLESMFHLGVIRYVKPFLNAKTNQGEVSYPLSNLKKVPGFSRALHDHLVTVRNTLIAHDDFGQIEPRLQFFSLTLRGTDVHIPTSVVVANKCLGYPADLDGAQKMQRHIVAVLSGVGNKLAEDLGMLRSFVIEHPEQAAEAEKYSRHCESMEIPKEGAQLVYPDFVNDQWSDTVEPDFSEIHNGFRYEEMKIRRDFHGPERISLPGGWAVELTPPDDST